MLRITREQHCAPCSSTDVLWFPLLPYSFFHSSPHCCGHPSPSCPSSFSLHHPLGAISKELAWVQSETPAPSEASQASHGPGQTLLSSTPIYFNSGAATSRCRGAGSPGTQLCAGVVPSSCPFALGLGWSGSSFSAAIPTTATPRCMLGAAEAAWPLGLCGAVGARRCWKLLLAVAMRGCHTNTLQCQESCGWPWIR